MNMDPSTLDGIERVVGMEIGWLYAAESEVDRSYRLAKFFFRTGLLYSGRLAPNSKLFICLDKSDEDTAGCCGATTTTRLHSIW